MKRVFVDYTRIGHADQVKRVRTRLFGSERDGLVPGTEVIIEGDSVPDRKAYFVEFLDDQMAVFSFESPESAGIAAGAATRVA